MTAHRLPTHVVPSRYDISIEPDLSASSFVGRETIDLAIREAVSEIVLNAADLTLSAVTIDSGGRRVSGTAQLDHETEHAVLRFKEPLPSGPARLSLEFSGTLNDKLRGFYRSTFVAADGSQATMAVTQFEATDARRAFPCWDEPAFKAVFCLTLVVDDGLAAIANTAVASATPLPGRGKAAVVFQPTVPMSTYLVAFVIGPLAAADAVSVGGIPVRVWAAPGKVRLTAFAAEAAACALRFFQDYYAVPYPGDKLDLIAIPDFAFGAMENLGAITFRETALLLDEAAATHTERTRVAHVVAHEIAHMWFGDLVTMRWWNGLWLNEAFATLMEVMAVDAWKPTWDRWDSFGASRAAAFVTDGLHASRPIEFEVNAPKDAEAMFDVLTYEKGGAVLRMLEQYLGPEVFRDGIRRYLTTHRFGNAETTDLWQALGEASGQPIPEIMDAWIFRQGYPVVTVEREGDTTIRFRQHPFQYLGDEDGASLPWQIPLTYRARVDGKVVRGRLLLARSEGRVTFPRKPDWIVANEGGHGFYRVGYTSDLLAPLLHAPAELLSSIERFNIIGDAWAATLAGTFRVADYLDLTARFVDDIDRHVWAPVLGSFQQLSRIVPDDARPGLERLVRDRLAALAKRLGLSSEPDEREIMRELRGEVVRTMGILGNDAGVQREARERFGRDQLEELDPNVRSALIWVQAHIGGAAEYERFLARSKAAKTPQEEQRYQRALAAFRSPELTQRTLRLCLSGDVRTQDAPFLVRDLLMGVHSRELAWAFVRGHWDEMERLYPSQSGLRRLCEGVTGLVTPALEADVRSFFAQRTVSFGGKTLEQYLEQLRVAVRFRERELAALRRYFGTD